MYGNLFRLLIITVASMYCILYSYIYNKSIPLQLYTESDGKATYVLFAVLSYA